MRKSKRIITWVLIIIGAVAAILFIAASVYINRFKPQLEDLLTRNIGMQTMIDGPISLKVMPGLSIAAHKVKVVNNETYILRIEKIEIAVDYTKLFSETIHVKELHFKRPQLYIVRHIDGSYNFETPVASVNPSAVVDMANHEINLSELTIKDASILYIDHSFEDTLKADGIYLSSDDIRLVGTLANFDAMKMRFKGNLDIDQFKLNSLKIDSLRLAVLGENGKLNIEEKSRPFLGGEITGNISFDFNKKPVFIQNQHKVTGMDMEQFFLSIDSRPYLTGFADYQLDLSFESMRWSTAMKSMNGSFQMKGKSMNMHGINLHTMFDSLASTQIISSVDLMAIFMAGPYGAVFTKGMDFEQLISGDPEKVTPIVEMNSDWKISNGQAQTVDVALNSGKYRIVLDGVLDFTADQYQDFEIALVNWEGCAAFSQTLNGPFDDPNTKGMLNLGLLKGPLDDISKMLSKPTHAECIPIYGGSVKHPSN